MATLNRTLNLGIVAHVDAGKTSLTERLLYDAGVIDHVGSVDSGSTQTDTDELERSRGITIRSAVVAFSIGDLKINLIDTPGHSDFIAEVERSLAVLDAAVLVISAVEGIQAQTRVLMRTLRRLRIPTILFVNKIDRMGARDTALLDEIRASLTDRAIAMASAREIGTSTAKVVPLSPNRSEVIDLLADGDERLLTEYVERGSIPVESEIARQLAAARLHLVYFGSAITGAGVAELADGIRGYLPSTGPSDSADPQGLIFKMDRADGGEKIAYVRMSSGALRARDQVTLHKLDESSIRLKVTAVQPFSRGTTTAEATAVAGDIARVWGLRQGAIGDSIGRRSRRVDAKLARPGLESVVTPQRPQDRIALHSALQAMAELDPLINTHLDGEEIAVSVYGEVQAQVLRARLATEYGVRADFAPARTVYVEKPIGVGEAIERMGPGCLFDATVGLRVEPGPPGLRYVNATLAGHMPVAFHRAIEETVHLTARQGIYGWQLLDCTVTLFESSYSPPSSTGGDFRNLTPLVLAAALSDAGTAVHEPLNGFEIDAPAAALRSILRLLGESGAALSATNVRDDRCEISGELPTAQVYDVSKLLPGITQGDGAFLSRPSGHRRVRGRPPTRRRTDGNPFNRKEYLLYLASH